MRLFTIMESFLIVAFHFPITCVSFTVLFVKFVGSITVVLITIGTATLSTMKRVY